MNEPKQLHDTGPRRIGAGMIVAAWLLVLGLLTAFFSGWLDRQYNPNSSIAGSVRDGGIRETRLTKNRGGHYVATGSINDKSAVFLLDTGATDIAVPLKLAEQLDLSVGPPIKVQTANGIVTVFATRLPRVRLGNIELYDVRANINPHMHGEEVLLGMSFLGKLEFTQRGDTLTLRQYPDGT